MSVSHHVITTWQQEARSFRFLEIEKRSANRRSNLFFLQPLPFSNQDVPLQLVSYFFLPLSTVFSKNWNMRFKRNRNFFRINILEHHCVRAHFFSFCIFCFAEISLKYKLRSKNVRHRMETCGREQ